MLVAAVSVTLSFSLVCPILIKEPEMEVDTLLCKISALVSLLSSLEKEVRLCGVKLLFIIIQTYMVIFTRGKTVMPPNIYINVLQIYFPKVPRHVRLHISSLACVPNVESWNAKSPPFNGFVCLTF